MCGIAGFLHPCFPQEQWPDTLRNMAESLAHRGPDDEGVWFDPAAGVGLAHRRLSVIDISAAGHQPMSSDDGRVSLVYNGEIYNFRDIRETLEALGHRFKSSSDTEVVLKAYIQWGADCLQKFVGMFSLALWDSTASRLFLARDRLGVKPLYYHLSKGVFLFASELKAIMAFRGFAKEIDADAIPLFLHYQYIPAPRTIFKQTYKLLPGHFLMYDGKEITTRAYWKLPDVPAADSSYDEEDELQKLDDLLTKAVSDRLISDVPLGALLSGGIDSSVVAAMMRKVSTAPVKTFSIGFREENYNEAPWAAKVAKHLRTDHTEFFVTPEDAIRIIPSLPHIYDEPFADASAIPTLLVSQLTRSHVTVALSGDGGDEQFAGYTRYWGTRSAASAFSVLPESVRKALAAVLRSLPPHQVEKCYLPWRKILPKPFRVANFPDKWQKLIRLMCHSQIQDIYRTTICLWSEEELNELFVCRKRRPSLLLPSQYESTFDETEGWPVLSRLMRVDQRTYLPDGMLTKVDRASMAASLEIRSPLLDHRVAELTSQLPEGLKYRNGTGKYLLKKVLARYVPESLSERPKMGFGVPIDQWFRGELNPLLMDYLSPERLRRQGMFNPVLIEKKIKEHLSGKRNHQYRLWAILMWEMWREQWIG